jgi:hypothetical protein
VRTWKRAESQRICGCCRASIGEGATMLELQPDSCGPSAIMWRCQPCGERMFGEHAPDLPALPPRLPVPQPTLPMEMHRGPDFVTPGQVARSTRFNALRDVRMRQTGEEG